MREAYQRGVGLVLGTALLGTTWLFASNAASSVDVKMTEFLFALSTQTVAAGRITFKVKNVGGAGHDFEVAGKHTSVLTRGGIEEVTVDLAPGTYEYRCTVPGHAEAGMKGVLTVR